MPSSLTGTTFFVQAVDDLPGALGVRVPQPLPVVDAGLRELAVADRLGDDLVALLDAAAWPRLRLEALDPLLLRLPCGRVDDHRPGQCRSGGLRGRQDAAGATGALASRSGLVGTLVEGLGESRQDGGLVRVLGDAELPPHVGDLLIAESHGRASFWVVIDPPADAAGGSWVGDVVGMRGAGAFSRPA